MYFNSIFDSTTNLDVTSILITAVAAIFLGLVVAFTHLKTSKTSKNFLVTLATLPLLVEIVMLMVNGNLGTSIAILGAFSLVRFRSIAGNSKEIMSVFFSMAIGLALGMGQVLFAAIMTVLVALVILALSKTKLFDAAGKTQTLEIVIPEDLDYTEAFSDIFDKFLTDAKLLERKTINMGSLYKLIYDIKLRTPADEKKFLDAIRVKNSNLKVCLSSAGAAEEI